MPFRRTLAKRFFRSPIRKKSPIPANTTNSSFHQRATNQATLFPEFLVEKLKSFDVSKDRIHLEGLRPPVTISSGISVLEAKKVLRSAQMERVRCVLKGMSENSVRYSEYVKICIEVCSSKELGEDVAKKLDECGNVIVLGDVVFLRPDQVAKSMEKLIYESIAIPNDPRKKELEQLEKQKAFIDQTAHKQVQAELYCGLGFLALQTLGFMRLTFWELSWDVMEPVCFFVTSLHFGITYGFFLRTSNEPTFEGFFKRRFKTKQKKLMEVHNFDVDKYDKLCKAFYPTHGALKRALKRTGHFPGSEFAKVVY